MGELPKKLKSKLLVRKGNNALRKLSVQNDLVDFSSNDYLGFSKSKSIFNNAHQYLVEKNICLNGATGSRLLSGNYPLYDTVESMLCDFHESEAALIFNSGYDANVGIFSSVPQRHDIIFYDEHIHASIRDGISMSHAKAYKFKHNDLKDLEKKYETENRRKTEDTECYVVTESVFSMDGDTPDLKTLAEFCSKNRCMLIVDEAHAIGVYGKHGMGLIIDLGLQDRVFARLVTFGKALGCHGAAILGSSELKQFLINFARSFIYTTALPPHSLATINYTYEALRTEDKMKCLGQNISFFISEVDRLQLKDHFIESDSAIHCCVIPGIKNVKDIARNLQKNGFDVKPILSPTVPESQERLRFCLHSYNSEAEISEVLKLLATFVN
jgi:8-amino-7-oxononanoate synthase